MHNGLFEKLLLPNSPLFAIDVNGLMQLLKICRVQYK